MKAKPSTLPMSNTEKPSESNAYKWTTITSVLVAVITSATAIYINNVNVATKQENTALKTQLVEVNQAAQQPNVDGGQAEQRYQALLADYNVLKQRCPPIDEPIGALPPKSAGNVLATPIGGLTGDKRDGTVVFTVQISTEQAESNPYLHTHESVIMADDGNPYRATYVRLGDSSAEGDNRATDRVSIYKSAPLNAEFKFQVPTAITKVNALNLNIGGNKVLYNNLIITWK